MNDDKKPKKIGIVGAGYVGKAFMRMVEDHYAIAIYDPAMWHQGPAETQRTQAVDGINSSDLAIVSVPTPSLPDGSCDISIVEEAVAWIKAPVILIKSTIKPGSVDYLKEKYGKRIVFSPEYVGEGKYAVTNRMDFQTDMKRTPFLILGGSEEDCNYILDILVPVLGPEKTYYKCPAKVAETIKYMENTYFGMKITFANEMYEVCKALGVDWYEVWQGWALDPRVDVMHTAVFPESRGFSGKCLPKDLNALVKASSEAGYVPQFLLQMLKSNAKFNPNEPVRVKTI